jgi:hypothetical protein
MEREAGVEENPAPERLSEWYGTFLARGPSENRARMLTWYEGDRGYGLLGGASTSYPFGFGVGKVSNVDGRVSVFRSPSDRTLMFLDTRTGLPMNESQIKKISVGDYWVYEQMLDRWRELFRENPDISHPDYYSGSGEEGVELLDEAIRMGTSMSMRQYLAIKTVLLEDPDAWISVRTRQRPPRVEVAATPFDPRHAQALRDSGLYEHRLASMVQAFEVVG